ncbi:MAG: hypothetical protein UZ13_02498 [Chloroflexi bacterium OLB13]|nr:MAG: hypothetical protein UZ13_02498 [Chloroflexi bacterium OLB13]
MSVSAGGPVTVTVGEGGTSDGVAVAVGGGSVGVFDRTSVSDAVGRTAAAADVWVSPTESACSAVRVTSVVVVRSGVSLANSAGVDDACSVGVALAVAVGSAVDVCVGAAVSVGGGVAVAVGSAVEVCVDEAVSVAVGAAVSVADGVAVSVGIAETVCSSAD